MRIAAMTADQRFRSSVDDELWACVVCGQMWPSRQVRMQDGIASDRRCPNHYARSGGELARTLKSAEASNEAARITSRYAAPPKFPGWYDVTVLPALVEFDVRPLLLHRGGSSAVLTISGTNLTASDTLAYGHAGITNAAAPVLYPVTLDGDGNAVDPFVDILVLTVQASGGVPVGSYSLTHEGSTYSDTFSVRN